MQYPAGDSLKYAYTQRNQLQDISYNGTSLVSYQYDLNGHRKNKQLANHTDTGYSYDMAGQLGKLADQNSSGILAAYEYHYNSVGNRSSVQRNNGTIEQYAYDDTDQLKVVDTFQSPIGLPNKVTKYEYDKVGNREQVTDNNITTTYQPNPLNQYDSINGQTLSYDLNGNLINNNGWNYQYDAQNRLITTSNGITQASFAYDGRNRCVSRTINGNTTYLYYDDWNLIEERDVNDNLLTSYVHGEKTDEIICRRVPGNTIYYHHDALGNVALLTDDSGKLVEHYAYDAFGKPTILNATNGILQTSAYGNRFLFTGREYLSRLELYDYRNRVYSPELGRFLQIDPIGFVGLDINLYRYCWNNPVNWSDPKGLLPSPLPLPPGVTWGGDGRSYFNGPKYGNWGGKNWCGGQNPENHGGKMGDKLPVDSSDECYLQHDICYQSCESRCETDSNEEFKECLDECDQQLLDCLDQLDDDPKKWKRPPPPGHEGGADFYRDWANRYF